MPRLTKVSRKSVQKSLLARAALWASMLGLTALPVMAAEPTGDVKFTIRKLALDANEGVAVTDVDGDGKLDVVAGRNWYRNPDFAGRPLRLIEDWNGYVQSNGDYVEDVDGDGRMDVVAGSFLPTQIHWYQNPGDEPLRLGQVWKQNVLVDTAQSQNEGTLHEDVDGDGRRELIINSWAKDCPMAVWRFVKADDGKGLKLVRHALGERGNGHGCGVGDISGDGKADVLVGQGWYEQPSENPWGQPWKFHADWDLHASLPMIIVDLNGDGKNDIIHGRGHDYGLLWWENQGVVDGKLKWAEHMIDRSFSQPHAMAWGDIDGDKKPDLVTGKRYYAHNGGDPGGKEAPCLYYYTWDAAKLTFTRHTIEEGSVGTGLQVAISDINGDGRNDIAVAGKSGTYLLINEGAEKGAAGGE